MITNIMFIQDCFEFIEYRWESYFFIGFLTMGVKEERSWKDKEVSLDTVDDYTDADVSIGNFIVCLYKKND